MRVFAFVQAESGRMVVAPAVDRYCWMLNMQHFVKHHVFNDISWCFGRIKRAADDYLVLRSIVMAKDAISFSHRPGQKRLSNRIVEKLSINGVKDLVQIVNVAVGQQRGLSTPMVSILS